ncbi:MAG: von Willebrand factor type A domain-containing protein [Deltaproteobacteria bacterium]|nr:von Willebrand factor type A domain-containing protein [Deltaproteobacteria bacterium]
MTQEYFEAQFLDFIEGRLSQEETTRFEQELSSNTELRASFEHYSKILEAERSIAQEAHKLHPNFSVKVMDRLDSPAQQGLFERLYMYLSENRKLVYSSVATCATLVLVLSLTYRPLPDRPGQQMLLKDMSSVAPQQEAAPPAGNAVLGAVVPQEVSKQEGASYKSRQQPLSIAGAVMAPQSRDSVTAFTQFNEKLASRSDSALSAAIDKSLPQLQKEKYSDLSGALGVEIAPQHFSMPPAAPARMLAESYLSVSENTPTLVQDEPVSTFSIDVDTASYANTRRFISSGQLPPVNAVRIEEFINYFDYNYPVQYEKPFTLSYEIAPSPLEKEKFLLKLGIKARDAQPNQKGWNIVLLVDVSGSMMDSNKLELLKRSLPVLVERMRPQDKIAIVTYAGTAGVVLDSTSGNEKARILSAIESLSSGGSTNGAGGISAAYEIAQQNIIEGGINRVILMTDGDFNVGVTSHEDLIRLIEQQRKTGITLTTIGVGTGNLKDGMMEQLADKGNGNYFYLDSFKEARKVLQTDLVGNMEVVAKDVKLQIEFNPQQVAQYRLVGYDNRRLQKQDFNNDAIDAGEIGTGHTVTALYEVVLTNTDAAKHLQDDLRYQKGSEPKKIEVPEDKRAELGFLKIRYKKPDEDRSNLIEYPIAAADIRKDLAQASDDFRFAAAVSYFGTLLRKSQYAGKYTFSEILSLAQGAKGADPKGYRQEFIELVKDAAALSRETPRAEPMDQ